MYKEDILLFATIIQDTLFVTNTFLIYNAN